MSRNDRRGNRRSTRDEDVSDDDFSQASTAPRPRRRRQRPPKVSDDEILASIFNYCIRLDEESRDAHLKDVVEHVRQSSRRVKDLIIGCPYLKRSGGTRQYVTVDCEVHICPDFINEDDGCVSPRNACGKLHICPQYVVDPDGCDDDDCDLGHNLGTRHNTTVLEHLGLAGAPDDVIFKLIHRTLRREQHNLKFPDVCSSYNETGGACVKRACKSFHICAAQVLQGVCEAPNCNLNHRASRVKPLLESRGMDTNLSERELMAALRRNVTQSNQTRRNAQPQSVGLQRGANAQQPPPAPARAPVPAPALAPAPAPPPPPPFTDTTSSARDDVCIDHMNRACAEPCPRSLFHGPRPYQWQVANISQPAAAAAGGATTWLNFHLAQNDELEVAFREPQRDSKTLRKLDKMRNLAEFARLRAFLNSDAPAGAQPQWKVNFVNMQMVETGGLQRKFPVRRISTISVARSSDGWATYWRWFFKDKNNKWIEYGEPSEENAQTVYRSDKESFHLENGMVAYKYESGPTTIQFETTAWKYDMFFDRMVQRNTRTTMEREVRRRPGEYRKLSQQATGI